ncbi:MAG: hypothetical protein AAGE80_15660 [Pseudomonadota bacterium]
MAKFVKVPQSDPAPEQGAAGSFAGFDLTSWFAMWNDAPITHQIGLVLLLMFFARLLFGFVFALFGPRRERNDTATTGDHGGWDYGETWNDGGDGGRNRN